MEKGSLLSIWLYLIDISVKAVGEGFLHLLSNRHNMIYITKQRKKGTETIGTNTTNT